MYESVYILEGDDATHATFPSVSVTEGDDGSTPFVHLVFVNSAHGIVPRLPLRVFMGMVVVDGAEVPSMLVLWL